ncbi:MAG TPA: hypothetical protein VJU80_04200, partial [Solirubrobacteraceae bacterium]|nr:hypothetical protein [Solirubrobacteraceae bacterium]
DAELLERFYSRLLRCKHLCSERPPKGHLCRPLGPVVQLAAQRTVAAGTAHRAMAPLRAEGLINAQRGKRALVLPPI